MDDTIRDDLDQLPGLLRETYDTAVAGLSGMDARPAAVPAQCPIREPLPEDGSGLHDALDEFRHRWEPTLSGSAGPRYLGLVTGGTTPAALAGDWLTSVYDQNVIASGDSGAPELERETIGWLADLFGIGDAHRGAFVTGGTMSNLVGLAIGREWLGEQRGVSVADAGAGVLGPVTVLSGTPHSSIAKSLSILGMGRDSLRTVTTLPDREAVDIAALETELEALDGEPAIVVANAGTVNSVDFDDLVAITELKRRHRFWLHVDAAFGGYASVSPVYAGLTEGMAEADSIAIDLHKWLNVPYDSGVQFTRRRDLQVQVFRNMSAYLSAPEATPDYLHLTPENSRRFRALASWFTLRAYGRRGHREIVERNIASARHLGDLLADQPGVRLVAPVRLNVVCWTLANRPTATRVESALAAITASGNAYLTPTVYRGTPSIRVAFSNWRTGDEDVRIVAAAIADAVAESG